MAMMEPDQEHELWNEAARRYHTDAEFHAKAHLAVDVLAADLRKRSGVTMSDDNRTLALDAAAVALVVQERWR